MNNILARMNGAVGGELGEQFSRLRWVFIASFAFLAFNVVGLFALNLYTGKPVSEFVRDPASVAGIEPYIGILTNVGIMLWTATAAVCFFGAALIRGGNPQATGFLFFGGAVTLILSFDDAFLVHEWVMPRFLIPEVFTYSALIIAIVAYLLYFLPRILQSDYLLLGMSAFFMGLMLAADMTLPEANWSHFIEDGSKFAGIVFWLAYFSITAAKMVGEEMNGPGKSRRVK